jgi:undecaprenyl-diphosphatase
MNLIFTIILGVVQGLTEFLPVSSSGHLILFRSFLNFEGSYGLAVDAVLQLATTFAILIYFHKDIYEIIRKFFIKKERQEGDITAYQIIVASIPVVIFGLLLEKDMDTIFRNPLLVAGSLIVGSIIMLVAERIYKNRSNLNLKNSLAIGLFQVLALVPGMSRSGMTISGGLIFGLKRETATRFSFIVALPVLLGSGLKKLLDLKEAGYVGQHSLELILGAGTAFVVGLLAIRFLVQFLKNSKMDVFAYYRIVLAVVIILVTVF